MEDVDLYALSVNFGAAGGVSSLFVSRVQRDRVLGFCAHSREVEGQVRVLWVTDTFGVTWFVNVEHVECVSASASPVPDDLVVVDSSWWADVVILAADPQATQNVTGVDLAALEDLQAAGDLVPAGRLLQVSRGGAGLAGIELQHAVWMRVAPAVVRRLGLRRVETAPPSGLWPG